MRRSSPYTSERGMSVSAFKYHVGCFMYIPGENDKGSPFVWFDDFPHESLEFEDRVRDVENREKP